MYSTCYKSFFINHTTRETTWTDPRLSQQQAYGGYQQQQAAYQQQQQQQAAYQQQQQQQAAYQQQQEMQRRQQQEQQRQLQQQQQQQQQNQLTHAAQSLRASSASSSGGYQMSSVSPRNTNNVSLQKERCFSKKQAVFSLKHALCIFF